MFDERMFGPYDPEYHGDLETYLIQQDLGSADNLFYGASWLYEINDLGIIKPDSTWIRLDRSPAPDFAYFVNEQLKLTSKGPSSYNGHCIRAPEGVYDPEEVLTRGNWSILGLDVDMLLIKQARDNERYRNAND